MVVSTPRAGIDDGHSGDTVLFGPVDPRRPAGDIAADIVQPSCIGFLEEAHVRDPCEYRVAPYRYAVPRPGGPGRSQRRSFEPLGWRRVGQSGRRIGDGAESRHDGRSLPTAGAPQALGEAAASLRQARIRRVRPSPTLGRTRAALRADEVGQRRKTHDGYLAHRSDGGRALTEAGRALPQVRQRPVDGFAAKGIERVEDVRGRLAHDVDVECGECRRRGGHIVPAPAIAQHQ